MAESYFTQTQYQPYQAGLEMEPTGEAKESDVKEQITIVNGGREKVGEAVTRKGGMEKLP